MTDSQRLPSSLVAAAQPRRLIGARPRRRKRHRSQFDQDLRWWRILFPPERVVEAHTIVLCADENFAKHKGQRAFLPSRKASCSIIFTASAAHLKIVGGPIGPQRYRAHEKLHELDVKIQHHIRVLQKSSTCEVCVILCTSISF